MSAAASSTSFEPELAPAPPLTRSRLTAGASPAGARTANSGARTSLRRSPPLPSWRSCQPGTTRRTREPGRRSGGRFHSRFVRSGTGGRVERRWPTSGSGTPRRNPAGRRTRRVGRHRRPPSRTSPRTPGGSRCSEPHVDAGVFVVAGRQLQLEVAARICDPPRPHRVVPRVLPAERSAPILVSRPSMITAVLGQPGALGPLGADLKADHRPRPTRPPGAATPVPAWVE